MPTLHQSFNRLARTLGRGVFPHQASSLLDLPWRKFILSPDTLAARLPLDTDSPVLEIGAGSGFYSVGVARRLEKERLVLLDLQPEMLAKARTTLRSQHIDAVACVAANASQLPFGSRSFGLIYLVTVLGEVRDQHQLLSEVRRVLTPNGILSISEHLPDPDFMSSTRMTALVTGAGFRLIAHHGRGWSYTVNFSAGG